MNLYTSVDNVLKRLDDFPADNSEQIWTRAELELYLQEGYNAFCRQTKCLFDMYYPENVSPAGNYMAKWERDYFESGMIAVGLMGHTGGYWERDYAQAGSIGPIRHNEPWEADYLADMDDTDIFSAFYPVPEDNVTVDRVTHDMHQLSPEWTRWFEAEDRDFQETQGDPWRFVMDRDGMSSIRLVPAGPGDASTYDVLGTYGLLRNRSEYASGLFDTDLMSGLIAYWRLNEATGTREDFTGGYHLSEVGSVSYAAGKYGAAASFADSSNYLTNTRMKVGRTGNGMTLALWIYRRAAPASSYVCPFSSAQSVNPAFQIRFNSSGRPDVYVRDGAGTLITVAPTAGDSMCDDAWHMLIVTYNESSDGLLHVYSPTAGYDEVSSTAGTSTIKDDNGGVMVGRGGAGPYAWGETGYTALVDAVAVWDRALSSDERDDLYAWNTTAKTVFGTWGSLREIPEHFPMGGQWGIPRRMYYDTKNTRVEYFRLGKDLDEYAWELPDRFVKYAEFYACAKALERDGSGQNMALAGHFMERFSDGVRRMVKRLSECKRAVVGQIGGTGRVPTKPALARLPWKYGRQIRRGY